MTHPGGRPQTFKDPDDLQGQVTAYFSKCIQEETNPGIYGLSDFLNVDPTTLYEYEQGNRDTEEAQFSRILIKARTKIIAHAENKVYDKTAGSVMILTNLTRKMPEPYKNAMHQEITGKDGGALNITITPNQASIV